MTKEDEKEICRFYLGLHKKVKDRFRRYIVYRDEDALALWSSLDGLIAGTTKTKVEHLKRLEELVEDFKLVYLFERQTKLKQVPPAKVAWLRKEAIFLYHQEVGDIEALEKTVDSLRPEKIGKGRKDRGLLYQLDVFRRMHQLYFSGLTAKTYESKGKHHSMRLISISFAHLVLHFIKRYRFELLSWQRQRQYTDQNVELLFSLLEELLPQLEKTISVQGPYLDLLDRSYAFYKSENFKQKAFETLCEELMHGGAYQNFELKGEQLVLPRQLICIANYQAKIKQNKACSALMLQIYQQLIKDKTFFEDSICESIDFVNYFFLSLRLSKDYKTLLHRINTYAPHLPSSDRAWTVAYCTLLILVRCEKYEEAKKILKLHSKALATIPMGTQIHYTMKILSAIVRFEMLHKRKELKRLHLNQLEVSEQEGAQNKVGLRHFKLAFNKLRVLYIDTIKYQQIESTFERGERYLALENRLLKFNEWVQANAMDQKWWVEDKLNKLLKLLAL